MIRFIPILLLLSLTMCRNKKSGTGPAGDPENTSEFISLFQPLELPWAASDSLLMKKDRDSVLMKKETFTRFVPDSILKGRYPREAKLRITPLGRVKAGEDTYLFAKTQGSSQHALYILAFNKKDEFVASTSFPRSANAQVTQSISIDRRFTITRTQLRKNRDGSFSEGKDVYAYSADAGQFMLIMTEALDEKATELINPIDTLPRTHKYAADYSNAAMNIISIRDGRREDHVQFYIHVEKNKGECIGELKGEATWKSPTVAEYREQGDPCILRFTFSKSAVTLKEIDGCGARRGLQCSFDGSYAKKKVSK